MEGSRRGLIQVYTGDGKGKTSAALGLALRASGQGLRVGIVQFMKGMSRCGEHHFVKRYPIFTIIQPNRRSYFRQRWAERQAQARLTLAQAEELLAAGCYDVLILDEILGALQRGLLGREEVLALMRAKPPAVELVLTGRGAPPEVIAAADLVTEMVAVKHPFKKGLRARRGIEY